MAVPAGALAASRAAGAAGTAKRAQTAAKASKAAGGASTAKTARKTTSGRANVSGAASKGDVARLRRQASASNDLYEQAYQAGVDGTPFDVSLFANTPGAREAWETGDGERAAGGRQERRDAATAAAQRVARPGGPGFVNDSAGFVLGLIVYALVINYLQGGPAQAKGWLGAKFLNKPYKR